MLRCQKCTIGIQVGKFCYRCVASFVSEDRKLGFEHRLSQLHDADALSSSMPAGTVDDPIDLTGVEGAELVVDVVTQPLPDDPLALSQKEAEHWVANGEASYKELFGVSEVEISPSALKSVSWPSILGKRPVDYGTMLHSRAELAFLEEARCTSVDNRSEIQQAALKDVGRNSLKVSFVVLKHVYVESNGGASCISGFEPTDMNMGRLVRYRELPVLPFAEVPISNDILSDNVLYDDVSDLFGFSHTDF